MPYSVEFTIRAEEDIGRIDKTIAQHIASKIDWLSQNIESIIPAPLKGEFKGKYKIRVGDWRVIYSFEQSSVNFNQQPDTVKQGESLWQARLK